MRVPDSAVAINNDVVVLNLLPRKIVLRDDDSRRASARARRDFQIEAMRGLAAEIDAREIFGEPLCDGGVYGRPPVLADQPLRLHVRSEEHTSELQSLRHL